MFEIDTSDMTDEQKQFIENIALFNTDTNYIMFCGSEDIKKKILPLLANRRLEDVKVSKLVEGIILIHKDMLKWNYMPYKKYEEE